MQLRWSAECWREDLAYRAGRYRDHWCPPLSLLSFVLCYMSLVPWLFGFWSSGCPRLRDGSRLALASVLIWNISKTVLFQIRPHCWSRYQDLLHWRDNLLFPAATAVFVGDASSPCATCVSLFKKSLPLLGVNLWEFAVLMAQGTGVFLWDKPVNINSQCVWWRTHRSWTCCL